LYAANRIIIAARISKDGVVYLKMLTPNIANTNIRGMSPRRVKMRNGQIGIFVIPAAMAR